MPRLILSILAIYIGGVLVGEGYYAGIILACIGSFLIARYTENV